MKELVKFLYESNHMDNEEILEEFFKEYDTNKSIDHNIDWIYENTYVGEYDIRLMSPKQAKKFTKEGSNVCIIYKLHNDYWRKGYVEFAYSIGSVPYIWEDSRVSINSPNIIEGLLENCKDHKENVLVIRDFQGF